MTRSLYFSPGFLSQRTSFRELCKCQRRLPQQIVKQRGISSRSSAAIIICCKSVAEEAEWDLLEKELSWDTEPETLTPDEEAELDRQAERLAKESSAELLAEPEFQLRGLGEEAATEAPLQTSAKRRKRADRKTGKSPDDTIPLHCLPKVAIVGRPNVGKSALFNRLTGSNAAIVFDYPGVTRDRMYTRAQWGTADFVVVDTGGLMSEATKLPADKRMKAIRGISDDHLPLAIERQAAAGVAEADSLVLVVDGQAGLTGADEEIMAWLRRTHPSKPLVLAVNKCENLRAADTQAAEFWSTGMEPIAVSAISGTGTGDLLDKLVATLPPPKVAAMEVEGEPPLPVAIVGRPNVGKSSLLNAIVGEERSIVSAVSGTTRDAVDTEITLPSGQKFVLIDTAGIRKRAAVSDSADGAEPLSVQRAIQAVRRSQVVVLVLDALECADAKRFVVTQQDFRLAELVAAEGRACVLVVNKWDAVPAKDSSSLAIYQKELLAQLRPLDWATVVFTSALSGQRVRKILEAAAAAGEEHSRRISTATLNMVVRETVNWRAPPVGKGGRRGRVYYATQAAVRPPTFVLFANDPDLIGEDYRKYVEKQLRANIGFPGSPLRIYWRKKSTKPNPRFQKQP